MTIAKWARDEKRILGASVFFAHAPEELRSSGLIFLTLAFQLAQSNCQYNHALYAALQKGRDIVSADLEKQFVGLFQRPLSACDGEQPILIALDALDALDECEDYLTLERNLLRSDVIQSGAPKLRVLITSTRDWIMKVGFQEQEGGVYHEELILYDLAHNDIQTYLEAEFAKLSSCGVPKIPKNWPSQEQFSKLHQQSGKTL